MHNAINWQDMRTAALVRELGGGGMSRVFVAEETALDRKVVIKVLPPETAAQVSLERFKREILLAAKLQHPHIVPLLTAGESNGLPYFTMPFVDGESLRVRRIKGDMSNRHGSLSRRHIKSPLTQSDKVAIRVAHFILDAGLCVAFNQALVSLRHPCEFYPNRFDPSGFEPQAF